MRSLGCVQSNMISALIKGGNWAQRQTHENMKVKIRLMYLQAKECQKLLANHQKLGERHGTDSLSQLSGGASTANNLLLDS